MNLQHEIVYGRQLIRSGFGPLTFAEIDLLAKYTKSWPYYKNRTTYVLLTQENFGFWTEKALNNYRRAHYNSDDGFIYRFYLKMKLQTSTIALSRIRRPPKGMTHKIEFSFAEDELCQFIRALNIY